MYACVSKYLGLSSSLKSKKAMDVILIKKQGILSVLGADSDGSNNSSTGSLRRTLSADMSSKNWLSGNGYLPPMKKTSSSIEFSISEFNLYSSSSSGDETENELRETKNNRESPWSSILTQKGHQEDKDKNEEFGPWSSILSQKSRQEDKDGKSLPPPYVHPLVEKSRKPLSEKSLAICTESLGSETGSDETGEMEEEKENGDGKIMKHSSCSGSRHKLSRRSFPPPIPSRSQQDGSSVYMKIHRDSGRLVLEAVSVPTNNNFCAKRQNGRLLLTFANPSDDSGENEQAEEAEGVREEGKGMEEEKKVGIVKEKRKFSSGFLKGCKEQKRSLMFWEPYCIATS